MKDMDRERRRRRVRLAVLLAGAALLCAVFLSAVTMGAADISLEELGRVLTAPSDADSDRIVYHLRMPRVICAALAGANLALSGCILQGILRNPLADPGIIGISAGAGLAAMTLMLVFPLLTAWVPAAAFAGALAAAFLVSSLAWDRGIQPLRLILAGVAVAAFFGGGMTALSVFFSERIQGTVTWMAGGFAGSHWGHVRMILPYTAAGMAAAVYGCRDLNALQLGEETASALGIRTDQARLFLTATAALLAASAVSVAGLLGFVGLIVPHIMRLFVGSDFEYLMPASALYGAVLTAGGDTAARTFFSPLEIPVGIFMAFIGAPFFLYLLKRRTRMA